MKLYMHSQTCNLCSSIKIRLDWNGEEKIDHVLWWQGQEDPALNSNVYHLAETMVQKHFPG